MGRSLREQYAGGQEQRHKPVVGPAPSSPMDAVLGCWGQAKASRPAVPWQRGQAKLPGSPVAKRPSRPAVPQRRGQAARGPGRRSRSTDQPALWTDLFAHVAWNTRSLACSHGKSSPPGVRSTSPSLPIGLVLTGGIDSCRLGFGPHALAVGDQCLCHCCGSGF